MHNNKRKINSPGSESGSTNASGQYDYNTQITSPFSENAHFAPDISIDTSKYLLHFFKAPYFKNSIFLL